MEKDRLIDEYAWAGVWNWRKCRARKEPNSSGYWGRCELKKNHDGDHALERGMIVLRWTTKWTEVRAR